jgi:predicted DsbA family dithiol-disulfide isomerase
VEVEIWSDIVCPWCYVGKRRFEAALAAYPERDRVAVRFRSFELDPARVADTHQTLEQMLARKYGVSLEQAAAMNARVTAIAAAEGLPYRLDLARPGNTFDAHRLTHLGAEQGIQDAVVERLQSGYFTEGALIGDHDVLQRLATDAGMDAGPVREMLASGRFGDEVRADEAMASRLGISGVPFFVIDRRYGVSGAQPAEMLLEALNQASREVLPTS